MGSGKVSKLFPVFVLALFLTPTHSLLSSGTTRYVNKSDATCHGQSPCYTTIQASITATQAGDTVRIQAGLYEENIVIAGKNSTNTATESDRITIEADPTAPLGSVILGSTDQGCTDGDAITVESSKFVTLRGLTITATGKQSVVLASGAKKNKAIHLERNRIVGNRSKQCEGGVTIGAGNTNTLIVNNLIHGNGQHGLKFKTGKGTHTVASNTIHGNGRTGIILGKKQAVLLVNNLITGNGADSRSPAKYRFGISRSASTKKPLSEQVQLLNNLICGNVGGELSGAMLDGTDTGNLTPTGSEGPAPQVSASPGCNLTGNVYANANGVDGQPGTVDDDFTLAPNSPAIDSGADPRTLALGVPNAIFEADFLQSAVRPQDGNTNGTQEFDRGAVEKLGVGRCLPGNTAECYDGPPATKGVGICQAGSKTCQPNGTFGLCTGQVLPAAEIPGNSIDEDCDGQDAPSSGCTPGTSRECYSGPQGTKSVGICRAGTQTCQANRTFGPCTGEVLPQTEILDNSIDEDCSGSDAHATFTLTASPATAEVIRGQSVGYTLMVTGAGFTQLATLGLSGLPAGMTGTFDPPLAVAGQTVLLTISVPTTQATQTVPLSVSASASVNGVSETHTTPLTLKILPVTTSFVGRTVVADELQTPLAGVGVTLLGRNGQGQATGCTGQTVSDAAGNFMFANLPAQCTGGQLIRYDGTTVSSPPGKYAGVDLFYDVVPNQVTTSPVLIHLPRMDDKETVCIQQNAPQDQTFTFQTIPDLAVTVYAGTTFTPHPQYPPPVGRCPAGYFGLIAIDVPVDRLPDAMPPDNQNVMPFIVAFQPPNAVASQPVAVTFPNTLNTPPGSSLELATLDPTKGVMVQYGTGLVSADGARIVPDFDPAHVGHRYGLVHFDWHGPAVAPNPDVNPCPDNCAPQAGDPIDLASGLAVMSSTDITIGGSRGGLSLQRAYRTLSAVAGPFGIGTNHNYRYRLNTNTPYTAAVVNLMMPDGNQFPLRVKAPPIAAGLQVTLINQTIPRLRGVEVTVSASNETDIRWKDGTVFHFIPATFQLGSVLDSITDPNGNRLTLVRNPNNLDQITRIVDPVGRELLLAYDNANRITDVTDPLGRVVRYTYNTQGRLATVTDPEGGVTRYDYDGQNRLTKVTDARNVVVAQNTYDANGRVIEQVQADGSRLKFAYTLLNPQIAISPVQETVLTDARGNRTTYRFTPQGFLSDVTDALGQTHVFDREPGTNLIQALHRTACNSCTTLGPDDETFTYDANGNTLTRTDAAGKVTSFTYEPQFNRVTSVTNPLGQTTTFTYDTKGNLTSVTDAKHHTTSFTYDAFGLLTTVTDPLNHNTTIAYDGLANPVTMTDPLGRVTTLSYDVASRLLDVTDALGRTNSTTYDGLNRIVAMTSPGSLTTQLVYDAVGNLLSLTDAKGHATSFTYDPMNRLLTKQTQNNRTDTRQYDANGNLTQFTDRRGLVATFAYDPLNRLTRETYQDSTVERTYDPYGRVLRVNDSIGGSFTFGYDLLGRLVNAASPTGTVRYQRDDLGRVISREVVGQPTVTYSYDAAGNLLSATSTPASVTFTYDPRDLLLSQMRSNGVATNYTYDALGQVLSLTHVKGTTALNAQSYTYSAAGERSATTTDIAQPLITQPTTSDYDEENRLTRRGALTYTYDENGNRLTQTGPSGTTTYTWDARNRLQSMTTPNGQTTTFYYDFGRNLLAKDTTGPGGNSETYVLDSLTNVVFQRNSNGQQFSVLTGRSIDSHLATISSTGQATFGLGDALNSIVATTDQNGTKNGQFFYEPYGETTAQGSTYPFQYTGRTPAPGGLYYYRARFYDPQAGRFVSEDPIGFGGGAVNLYGYVGEDPISYTDPTGQILPALLACAANPVCRGVVLGGIAFAGNAAYQLYKNGGNIHCVDWGEATAWGAGGVGASVLIGAGLSGGANSVFWSGYSQGARTIAEGLGTTLEQTPIGGALDFVQHGIGINLPSVVWDTASAIFAGNATGTATAVILSEGMTWSTIELPILMSRGVPLLFY